MAGKVSLLRSRDMSDALCKFPAARSVGADWVFFSYDSPMSKHARRLTEILAQKHFPEDDSVIFDKELKSLQLEMLRIQQGIWHGRQRAIVVFEGFDASGKGSAIRRLVARLDPRGIRVHGIGPPDEIERTRHYLDRFWSKLPAPGMIAVFDRSWYGRVLVERVEKLTPESRWKEAYQEINEFEGMLKRDGIDIIKIFLAVHPGEQLRRFEERLRNPSKHWKLREEDLRAHRQWKKYVGASDDLLSRTETKNCPWNLVPADSKPYTHQKVLEVVTEGFRHHAKWLERAKESRRTAELRRDLNELRKIQRK